MDKEELFPEAYALEGAAAPTQTRRRRFSGFVLMCAAAPIVLYGVLYFIYLFILGSIGEKLIGTVP